MATLVIDGHPNADSLTAALARRYTDGHGEATLLAVRDLDFDPNMRFGYTRHQELEPDLRGAWEALTAADHVVLMTPVWWNSVPALLKGFFDRILLPREAYRYRRSGLPEGLLTGRTGRVVVTTDSPWWWLRLVERDSTVRNVRHSTLGFCGISPIRATRLGPVRTSSPAKRERWLARVEDLGRADAATRPTRRQPALSIQRTSSPSRSS